MLKTTRVRAAHIQFQQGVSKCKFWHTLLFRTILMAFDQHSPLGHDRVVSNRQHSLNRDFGGVAQGENDHFLPSEASLAFATVIFAPPEAYVGVKMVIFT